MKRIFKYTAQLCAMLLFAVVTAHVLFPGFDALAAEITGFSPSTLLSYLTFGTDNVLVLFAEGWLVKATSDPQLLKKWSDAAIKLGENKTEFTESDIGVSWGDDGPLKSQQMPASPIKLEQNLQAGGKYIDVPIENPLYKDTSDILNVGRYEGQNKVGAEEKLTRDNFRCPIDKWALPIGEEDLEEGFQQTANTNDIGKLMSKFVDRMTDHEAQRKDTGLWAAWSAGADYHHFINAAVRADLSSGAVPVKDVDGGLMFAPSEHRRSYVWYDGKLNEVTYSDTVATFEGNITTALSAVDADDKPTLAMLRKISRICKNSAMIPCTMKADQGNYNDVYFVYIPGGVRDLLEDDASFEKVMNNSYQGQMKKNPMLHSADVVYKNLIIRDSAKLDKDDYFTAKHNFNAIENDLTDTTKITFTKSGSAPTEKYSIIPGTRQFADASTALGAFGQANTHVIKRIAVMGAAAMVRAQGKQHGLKRKKEDDYESKIGLSKTCQFGQMRVEHWEKDGTYKETPQSFQVFCLGEEV